MQALGAVGRLAPEQRTARGIEYRWVNPKRARNEPLDCTVYAVFCTHQLNLHLYTAQMWQRLEDAVQPANADLFAVPVQAQAPAPPAEAAPLADVPLPPAVAPAVAVLVRPLVKTHRPRPPGRFGASPAWR